MYHNATGINKLPKENRGGRGVGGVEWKTGVDGDKPEPVKCKADGVTMNNAATKDKGRRQTTRLPFKTLTVPC